MLSKRHRTTPKECVYPLPSPYFPTSALLYQQACYRLFWILCIRVSLLQPFMASSVVGSLLIPTPPLVTCKSVMLSYCRTSRCLPSRYVPPKWTLLPLESIFPFLTLLPCTQLTLWPNILPGGELVDPNPIPRYSLMRYSQTPPFPVQLTSVTSRLFYLVLDMMTLASTDIRSALELALPEQLVESRITCYKFWAGGNRLVTPGTYTPNYQLSTGPSNL